MIVIILPRGAVVSRAQISLALQRITLLARLFCQKVLGNPVKRLVEGVDGVLFLGSLLIRPRLCRRLLGRLSLLHRLDNAFEHALGKSTSINE